MSFLKPRRFEKVQSSPPILKDWNQERTQINLHMLSTIADWDNMGRFITQAHRPAF